LIATQQQAILSRNSLLFKYVTFLVRCIKTVGEYGFIHEGGDPKQPVTLCCSDYTGLPNPKPYAFSDLLDGLAF
jgi:hypothetical protein